MNEEESMFSDAEAKHRTLTCLIMELGETSCCSCISPAQCDDWHRFCQSSFPSTLGVPMFSRPLPSRQNVFQSMSAAATAAAKRCPNHAVFTRGRLLMPRPENERYDWRRRVDFELSDVAKNERSRPSSSSSSSRMRQHDSLTNCRRHRLRNKANRSLSACRRPHRSIWFQ